MWQQIVDWARLLWNTGEEVQDLRREVNDLQVRQSETNELIRVLATQNELLRRDLAQERRELAIEREKRADDLEKIELRLRLQISEELRRLPPNNGN